MLFYAHKKLDLTLELGPWQIIELQAIKVYILIFT